LVVVEGYTDVIAAWQAGLRDVVACLGTAINEKHCRLIKRFADRITLVLDGDEAGRKQANNVIELFVTQDVDLRILTLPDEMDPLDFLQREGGERFRQMVGDAHDAIEHKLRTLTAGVDLLRDTHRANAALDEMLKTLSRVPASVFSTATERGLRQDQLLTRFARQFGVDIERLRVRLAELRQAVRPEPRARTPVTSGPLVDFSKLNKRESQLIQVLLNSPEHLDFVIENVAPEQFQQGPLKELYCIIEDCFQRGEAIDFQNLLLVLECPDLKCVLHHLQAEWQDMQSTADLQSIKSPRPLAAEIVDSFRQTSLDVERQKRISQLQLQKLEPEEETQTLIDLLNQTRQRHR
jgi:DNA primase